MEFDLMTEMMKAVMVDLAAAVEVVLITWELVAVVVFQEEEAQIQIEVAEILVAVVVVLILLIQYYSQVHLIPVKALL